MVGGVSVKGVSKTFRRENSDEIHALKDINLEIAPGEFVTLIGASGCGKSTLLRVISGLTKPDCGEALTDGEKVAGPSPERGFAFQDHTLFPWLNIRQNVSFGLKEKGLPKGEIREITDKWLNLAGLMEFEKSFPHELSGGMCQRASLVRALAARPKVIMLDEPLGALDAFTRMNMQDEILRIWLESRVTVIMVTHDVDEAVYMSDRIIILSPRPGRVQEIIGIDMSRPRARSGDEFSHFRAKILDILHFGGARQEPGYYL
jgi:ABC-type nitrate/sulfonate/bicarbonate transport system ATPase subunit